MECQPSKRRRLRPLPTAQDGLLEVPRKESAPSPVAKVAKASDSFAKSSVVIEVDDGESQHWFILRPA
eukprot:s2884_g6.t1